MVKRHLCFYLGTTYNGWWYNSTWFISTWQVKFNNGSPFMCLLFYNKGHDKTWLHQTSDQQSSNQHDWDDDLNHNEKSLHSFYTRNCNQLQLLDNFISSVNSSIIATSLCHLILQTIMTESSLLYSIRKNLTHTHMSLILQPIDQHYK